MIGNGTKSFYIYSLHDPTSQLATSKNPIDRPNYFQAQDKFRLFRKSPLRVQTGVPTLNIVWLGDIRKYLSHTAHLLENTLS